MGAPRPCGAPMSSRFLLSLVAAAVLQALWLDGAASAAEPGAAVVVAQLGPPSPGFKMGVNRSETGAPEATAIGAMPIEKKPGAAKSAEWRGNASHPSAEKEEDSKAASKRPDDRKSEAKAIDDK